METAITFKYELMNKQFLAGVIKDRLLLESAFPFGISSSKKFIFFTIIGLQLKNFPSVQLKL